MIQHSKRHWSVDDTSPRCYLLAACVFFPHHLDRTIPKKTPLGWQCWSLSIFGQKKHVFIVSSQIVVQSHGLCFWFLVGGTPPVLKGSNDSERTTGGVLRIPRYISGKTNQNPKVPAEKELKKPVNHLFMKHYLKHIYIFTTIPPGDFR